MSQGREVAEKIAALFGTVPDEITVTMIGNDDVRDLLEKVSEANRRAHEKPIMARHALG